MNEAALCRRGLRCGLGLVCILLLARCAVAQAGAATPQATNPATPALPGTPAAPVSAAPAALPAWEVSTVKPASPDARGSMIQYTSDGVKTTNVPLWMMVREAFGLENDRLFGGPGWAKTTNFDVEAKVSAEDAPKLDELNIEQRRQMMVALLEERFGLKFHHETREMPMYELVVARGGVKMQTSKPDVPDPGDDPPQAQGQPPKPGRHMMMMRGRGHIESTGSSTTGFVHILSSQLGRTVLDKTGLTGEYDFKLDWTPDDTAAMPRTSNPTAGDNPSPQDAGGPSLFTALEEQLGLKLESTKGPVDVVVVDALEQPTAN